MKIYSMDRSDLREKLLTLNQVRERVTLSKQEIYRRIKRGEFPRQVRIGTSRVAWVESEIQEWIAQAISNR